MANLSLSRPTRMMVVTMQGSQTAVMAVQKSAMCAKNTDHRR
jgi:hypothetical protein